MENLSGCFPWSGAGCASGGEVCGPELEWGGEAPFLPADAFWAGLEEQLAGPEPPAGVAVVTKEELGGDREQFRA